MLSTKEIEEIFQQLPIGEDYLPGVAINCIVFGYHNRELKVLCTRQEGFQEWYLPSGYVKLEERIDLAAYRILQERTGVENLFLKQFATFGDENRSFAGSEIATQISKFPLSFQKKIDWMINKRFVAICYYALVEFSKVEPKTDFFSSEWTWADVTALPPLILDHNQMIHEALKTMRRELHYEPIGMNLLPEKFTIAEIQALYETILDKKLDNRNFVKKLVLLDILKKTNEKRNIGGHRSPTLYKLNKRPYKKALKQEFELMF
jgi:ADP-ribose pyrophosphatase YjhB (NUDIX family)